MIVAGVDLGVHKAALSIFQDGELTSVDHLELTGMNRSIELATIGLWVFGYTKVVDHVFIEKPLIGRNTDISLQLAQTCGAVMAAHGHLPGHDVRLVSNTSWKKEVVGSGNADKFVVRNWLEAYNSAYADLCGSNQDRVDAIAIGLYGVICANRADKLLANL